MTPEQVSEITNKMFEMIEPILKEHGFEAFLIVGKKNEGMALASTEIDYETAMSLMEIGAQNIHKTFMDEAKNILENN